MKKTLLVLATLVMSFASFSQKLGLDFSISRGGFADTYKQLSASTYLGETFFLKGAFGIDNMDKDPRRSYRDVASLGAGALSFKHLETYGMFSLAFDHRRNFQEKTRVGATLGANYVFFNTLAIGVACNSFPVIHTPYGRGSNPFPMATVGLRF